MNSLHRLVSSVVVITCGLMLACGGGSAMKLQQSQPPDIYVAGFESTNSSPKSAMYWKNGTPVTLGSDFSWANAIFVSGNDVYVAGYDNGGATYWKNGVGVRLPGQTDGREAHSVFVNGNDVYVAGYVAGNQANTAVYWKNGVPVALTDGTNQAQAISVLVSGSDVYVTGWEEKTTQVDPTHIVTYAVAKYWKNGTPVSLTDGLKPAYTSSIFLSGNDIYVAGEACQDTTLDCSLLATYWKNGTQVVLTNQYTTASSVFASGTDVYVAGNHFTGGPDSTSDLWKDGMLTQLSIGQFTAASQIVVSGGDVYVAGAENGIPGASQQVAGYWKNGNFVPLTDGTTFAAGSAMAVVQH